MIRLEQLTAEDGPRLRALRLRALRDAPDAFSSTLGVAPEVRRQGVGAALVDAVIDWARSNGARRLLLDVADHNTSAIALYARKGFARNEIVAAFPPPREHIREHQWELRLGLTNSR